MFALRVRGAVLLINTHAADHLLCRTVCWSAGRTAYNRKRPIPSADRGSRYDRSITHQGMRREPHKESDIMDIGKVNVCYTAAAPSEPVPLYIRPTPDELAVEEEEMTEILAAQAAARSERLWARESARAQRWPDRFPLPKWKG